MEFFLLGPVMATVGGQPVELGRRRERFVLALLLLDVGKPMAIDRLIELLWDDDLPRDPRGAVHVHVSRLRRRLAAAGAARFGVSVVSTAAGYAMVADPGSVDAHRFVEQVAQARVLADAARRAAALRGALALWRGEPMADVAPPDLRSRLGSHLAELRLTALEMRVDADLELGRHDLLIPELTRLTAEHPARERLIAARMLALYRDGRQRDALAVYGQAAHTLAEQFGLDSGSALRELRTAILRQDDQLAAGPVFGAKQGELPRPAQLPADLRSFVGRAPELSALSAAADAPAGVPVVVTITGMPGAGKTALAVRAGHQLAGHYPDGQLFMDLHGFTEGVEPVSPADALDRMLRSLGVPAAAIPAATEDRAALYRGHLAGRRVLIVLDNAATESQVTPLLPAAPGCLLIITSRLSMAGLDNAAPLLLDVLSRREAAVLLASLIGDPGVVAGQSAAIEQIVELCGRLPLAVGLAASRLRHRGAWSAAYLADRLGDARSRLAELYAGERSVEAAIGLSYGELPGPERDLFQVLGLLPAVDVDSYAAAAAAAAEPGTAGRLLERLVDAHLLAQPAPGRYQLHDLIRLYAARRARESLTAAGQADVLDRLCGYYLSTASAAVYVLAPHQMRHPLVPCPPGITAPPLRTDTSAMAWLDTERRNLLASALQAPERGLTGYAGALAETLFPYLEARGQFAEAVALYELAARDAGARGDDDGQASALLSLGIFYQRAGRGGEALGSLRGALAIHRRRGATAAQGRVLINLGRSCLIGGLHDEALAHLTEAIELHRALGDRAGEERALRVISNLLWERGQHADAIAAARDALAISKAAGFAAAEANASLFLGIYASRLGDHQEALDHFERAARLFGKVGDLSGRSHALAGLGAARAASGQGDLARADLRTALILAHETGDQNAEFEALHSLAEVLALAGEPEDALSHAQAALELAAEREQPREQLRALDATARILLALGRQAQARDHWERAIAEHPDADVLEIAEIRGRLAALRASGQPGTDGRP